MSVLEEDPAHHRRNLINRPKRSRPIRNRKPGIFTGDKGSGDEENKDAAGENHGKAVETTMKAGGNNRYDFRPHARCAFFQC